MQSKIPQLCFNVLNPLFIRLLWKPAYANSWPLGYETVDSLALLRNDEHEHEPGKQFTWP